MPGGTPPPQRRRLVVRLGLAMTGVLAAAPMHLVWTDPEEVFYYGTRRREVVAALGVLPYHVYDVSTYALSRLGRMRVDASDRARVERYFDVRRSASQEPGALFGRAGGLNVIVVMAESLIAAPLDLEIDGRPVAPALSRFARESLRFTNVFEQTHVGTTADGEFLSMQGLLPLPNGVVATRYPANTFSGLPAALAKNGYETVSAHANSGDFWNRRQMHVNFGFQRSYFREEFQQGEVIGMGLADSVLFDQMEVRLRTARQPFMSFLITLSNHLPYVLPASTPRLNVGPLEGTTVGHYLQSVHHFDGAFEQFVERLRQSGLLDRSLVVVYGDHRAFWEAVPQLPRLAGIPADDAYRTWALERRVPLLIRLPRAEGAGTIADAGGQLDIPPTVLGLLGVPSGGEVMLGRDLLAPGNPLVVFRDGSVIAGRFAAIESSEPRQRGCFDIRSGARTDCAALNGARRMAREQMEISDLVIRGDLIETLRRPPARPTVVAEVR
jgi:phosphoglycerol transferase MdoB-like AlkP superfamily enzyme